MNPKNEFYSLRRQRPFVPFRIVATDGRQIEVTEPFMFGFNDIMVFVAKEPGTWRAKYSDIASIEQLKPPVNGVVSVESFVQLLDRITINPAQCGGKPCIRGKRIRVSDVLELLATDMSHEQILKQMPDLEDDDIRASLAYAARCTEQTRQSA